MPPYQLPTYFFLRFQTSYLDCTTRGPRNGWLSDREFLLVDELHGHQFLTARTYPAMILVETEVTDKQVGFLLLSSFFSLLLVDRPLSQRPPGGCRLGGGEEAERRSSGIVSS